MTQTSPYAWARWSQQAACIRPRGHVHVSGSCGRCSLGQKSRHLPDLSVHDTPTSVSVQRSHASCVYIGVYCKSLCLVWFLQGRASDVFGTVLCVSSLVAH